MDDTGAQTDAGAAYVFDAATSANLLWTLNNPTPAIANDQFGYSRGRIGQHNRGRSLSG